LASRRSRGRTGEAAEPMRRVSSFVGRKAAMWPWYDYGGRLSLFKLAVFVALFAPALWVALADSQGWLGARPLNEAIREIGLWTIRLIFLALAVTPLRQVLDWPRLILVRRMIGVAACAYVLVHLFLYTAQQGFDLADVAREIALRVYLTIGFTALLGLAVLAATSTDGMVRRLGGRAWQRLHRLVYPIGVLAVIHFMFQSKLGECEPTIMAGLLVWLLGYRLLARLIGARRGPPLHWLAGLGLVAAAGTALGEACYFRLAFHAPLLRVLDADFSLATGVRPAVVVLLVTLAVTLAAALRQAGARSRKRPASVPRPA
jgi:methionine sulfoxide reductase heme-binding subunit